jgi:hypothetical protein
MNMRSGVVEDRARVGRRAPIVVATAAAVSGYLAVWLPWRLAMFRGTSGATNMVDGMQPLSLLLLVLIGFVAGAIVPRYFWIGGVFSMALFPALAISDIVRDRTSHNLFPMELMIYGALTVPGIIAGFVGKSIVRFGKRA